MRESRRAGFYRIEDLPDSISVRLEKAMMWRREVPKSSGIRIDFWMSSLETPIIE
jgi:hypothetical protein